MGFCLYGIGGWWRKRGSVRGVYRACSFRNIEDQFTWAFAGVCGGSFIMKYHSMAFLVE
jgi:hypothetical protein